MLKISSHAFGWTTAALAAFLLAGVAALANANAPAATANLPVAPDVQPIGQAEPVLAMAGDHAVFAWTDMRNTAPDVYARVLISMSGTTVPTQPTTDIAINPSPDERRLTNLAPKFEMPQMWSPAVAMDPDGKAYFAYSDASYIYAAKLIDGLVVSRTQITSPSIWYYTGRNPQIASNGAGQLILVWEDFRNQTRVDITTNRGVDVYYTLCNAASMSCQANTRVNTDVTGFDQRHPRVSRAGNHIAIVWEDHREQGSERPRIYGAISNDGGATWSTNMRVNSTTSGSMLSTTLDSATNPDVTMAPDGTAWAVWEYRSGTASAAPDIFAAQWNGTAWLPPMRVDKAPAGMRALHPSVASGPAGVFVAWTDYRKGTRNPDIYSARLLTPTILPATPVADAPLDALAAPRPDWVETMVVSDTAAQRTPRLAMAGNRVFVAWRDDRASGPDVYWAQWNGVAWGNHTQINENAPRVPAQMFPDVENGSGRTYAAFLDTRTGYLDAYLVRMLNSNGVLTWSAPIRLPTQANEKGVVAPDGVDIAIDGTGTVHGLWVENYWQTGRQVFFGTYSTTGWSEGLQLTGQADYTRTRWYPAIAARGNVVAGVWTRRDDVAPQLHARWKIGSGDWVAETPVMTQPNPNDFALPASIALDDAGNLFVAWRDPVPANQNNRSNIRLARRNVHSGGGWTYSQLNLPNIYDWCDQRSPQLTVDALNRVHVVWSGCRPINPPSAWPRRSVLYYSISTNAGASWSVPIVAARTMLDNDPNSGTAFSQPAIKTGVSNQPMLLYPAKLDGQFKFYAASVDASQPALPMAQLTPTLVSDGAGNWATWGNYGEGWYNGDSRAALAFDPAAYRWMMVFPDRRTGRNPTLLWALDPGAEPTLTPTPTVTSTPTSTPAPTGTGTPTPGPTPTSTPLPGSNRVSLPFVSR